ncbi:MAG: long-chain acyl-CoA synthetase, partial [Frankiaceae bacterium]|nr:long-chain acyl-CoA synthetase [Frankiaceae bacterium]
MTADMATTPTGTSLQRLSELVAERLGGESLLHFEGATFTGAQLAERSRRLSRGLRDAGLRPGERVVVCMANCPEVSLTYSAVWRAGAATTPVLFLLSEDELRHVLVDSAASYVVTTPEFLAKVVAAAGGVDTMRAVIVSGDSAGQPTGGLGLLDLAELERASEGDIVDRDPSDLAALLYTGGTTGRSKGVMLSHDALSSAAWAAVAAGKATGEPPTTSSLLPLPLSHVYGLTLSVMGLHATEPGTSVLMRWFDPVGWLQLAQEHRTEISALVPSMIQMLLAQPMEDYDLSALRRLASGGASLAPEVAEEFVKRLPGVEITEGYGCTESAAIISTSPPGQTRTGSVGKPPPLIDVRIEQADGTAAPPGADGEICVRGPNLMTGYW